MSNRTSSRAVVTIIAVLIATGSAVADTPVKEQAKRDVAAGLVAQAEGRYDEAIELYQRAYDAIPHPEILFNLGQAHRLRHDFEISLRHYRGYLAVEPRGRLAPEARRWVAALERHVAESKADEARAAEARAAEAEAARDAEARKADVQRAAEAQRAAAEQQALHARPSAPASRWTPRRKLAVVTAGAGLAIVGMSGAIGLSARSLERDAFARCPDPMTPCDAAAAAQRSLDRARTRVVAADVGFAVGAAAVIGGAVLWWVGRPREGRVSKAAVVPTVSSTSAGVMLCTAF
jgi:tetratricopeptide (TPR) repeat protein